MKHFLIFIFLLSTFASRAQPTNPPTPAFSVLTVSNSTLKLLPAQTNFFTANSNLIAGVATPGLLAQGTAQTNHTTNAVGVFSNYVALAFVPTNQFVTNATAVTAALAAKASTNLASATVNGLITSNAFATAQISPGRSTGASRTPPRGLNTYNALGTGASLTDTNIMIDALRNSTNGMLKGGYDTYVIDEGWQQRDANGLLEGIPAKFPRGMSNLIADIYAMGYKHVGVYLDWTIAGAGGFPGLYTNIAGNATNIARWNVDYIKLDGEGTAPDYLDMRNADETFYAAWMTTGKPLYLETGGYEIAYPWSSTLANTWRCGGGIGDAFNFANLLIWLQRVDANRNAASEGHWNNIDGLWGDASEDKGRMSIGSIISVPYTFTAPYNNLSISYYTNKEVLAINDDFSNGQGRPIFTNATLQVWVKKLEGNSGRLAVGILNVSGAAATITFPFTNSIFGTNNYTIRDLWAGTISGYSNQLSTTIASHSGALYKLFPDVQTQWKAGTNRFGSDQMHWMSITNFLNYPPLWGTDPNGGTASLGGTNYTDSVGIMASTTNTYWLGGQATIFSALLGNRDTLALTNQWFIYGDGALIATSAVQTAGQYTNVTVSVAGYNTLTIEARSSQGFAIMALGYIYCPTETRSGGGPGVNPLVVADALVANNLSTNSVLKNAGTQTIQPSATNAIIISTSGILSSNANGQVSLGGGTVSSKTNYVSHIEDTNGVTLKIVGGGGTVTMTSSTFYFDGGSGFNGNGQGLTGIPTSGVSTLFTNLSNFETRIAANTASNTIFSTNFIARTGGTMSGNLLSTNATGTNLFSAVKNELIQGSQTNQWTNGNSLVTGSTLVSHLGGLANTSPTIATNVGAGTGGSATIAGDDLAGIVSVTTGTSPVASTNLATITFGRAYTRRTIVTLTPATASAGNYAFGKMFVVGTSTNFVIWAGATAYIGSLLHEWNYHVIEASQ